MRPTITNAKGINRVIDDLTTFIASQLSYINKAYGQAVTIIREVDGRPKRIPAIPTKDRYLEMFPDGSVQSLLFGIAHDPAEVLSFTHQNVRYKQNFSLIFWLDQALYDDLNYLATDEIMADVISTIKASNLHLQLIETYKEHDNVYQNFDYEITKSQYLMYPYTGFRLLYEARYADIC